MSESVCVGISRLVFCYTFFIVLIFSHANVPFPHTNSPPTSTLNTRNSMSVQYTNSIQIEYYATSYLEIRVFCETK